MRGPVTSFLGNKSETSASRTDGDDFEPWDVEACRQSVQGKPTLEAPFLPLNVRCATALACCTTRSNAQLRGTSRHSPHLESGECCDGGRFQKLGVRPLVHHGRNLIETILNRDVQQAASFPLVRSAQHCDAECTKPRRANGSKAWANV